MNKQNGNKTTQKDKKKVYKIKTETSKKRDTKDGLKIYKK